MRYFLIIIAVIFFAMSGSSEGAGKRISESGNKHNFSYTNLSANFRAVQGGDPSGYNRDSQICVFCHTPHRSSGEGPLWNRAAVTRTFKHYSSSTLVIDDPALRAVTDYGQPNGSSRLCLSCHDGVTAIGAVFSTPGSMITLPIQFTDVRRGLSGPNVSIGFETFSSHHPVSFKYNVAVRAILGGTYWYNPPSINEVKLDKLERMQCTTCHDPHQDKSSDPDTPFWTSKTYAEVCLTCHNIVPPAW